MKKKIVIKKPSLKLVFASMTVLSLIASRVNAQDERKEPVDVQSGVTIYDGPNGTETYLDGPKGKNSMKINYVLTPSKWDKCNLTYKFENYTSDISVAAQRMQIIDAFATWKPYSDFTFTEISSGSADISIAFATGDHGDGAPFDGTGGVLAHAYIPFVGTTTSYALIHFDDAENWASTDLQTVALHEIGHTLGLDHSAIIQAVMYATYSGIRRSLNEDDIAGIKSFTPEISGATVLCPGWGANYTYPRKGASSFQWSYSTSLQGPASGSPAYVTSVAGPNLGTLSVSTNNGCYRTLTIATNTPSAPTNAWFEIVFDDGIHCHSNAFTTPITGATSYLWTQPSSTETSTPQNPRPLIANRTYSINVRSKNSCGTSAAYSYSGVTYSCAPGQTTDIASAAETKQLSVYPNPANTLFEIGFPDNENSVRIKMTNMTGQVLRDVTASGSKAVIQSSDIPAGIYILNVSSDNLNTFSKIQIVK